jgi:4-hydroxybenzoate polyprenyltransferase
VQQEQRTTVGRRTALLRSAHPGPAAAVVLLAALLTVTADLPPARAALVVAAVLAGQLSIGWSNDLIDASRDRQVHRSDKPLATGEVSQRTVRRACAAAVLLTLPLSFACGLLAGATHVVCVAAGWAYNLGLKSTAWSWLPYAVAFGGLPAFVTLAHPDPELPPLWVPLVGALLGVGAHLVNALPDLADDEATGVRGLPHRLGARWAPRVATLVLVTASVVVAATTVDAHPLTAVTSLVLVGALAVVALAGHGRTPFRAAVAIALVDVALLAGVR